MIAYLQKEKMFFNMANLASLLKYYPKPIPGIYKKRLYMYVCVYF